MVTGGFCAALRAREGVRALWQELLVFAQSLAAAAQAEMWAVALELCAHTLAFEGDAPTSP